MANTRMLQQQYGQYQEDLSKYGQELNKFNFAADVYNRQAKEYQAMVDAYKALPQVQAYEKAVADYNAKIPDYNKKVDVWKNTGSVTVNIPLLGARTGTPERMYNALASYSGNPAQTQSQRDYLINTFYPGASPAQPTALPQEILAQKPGEFTAKKPELTAVAPKDPGFTGQQMSKLQGQQTLAQQERSDELGLVQRAQGRRAPADSIIGGLLQNVRYST